MTINERDIREYFFGDYESEEYTRRFIKEISEEGFDNSVDQTLIKATELWAFAKPGSEAGYAAEFVEKILCNKNEL